MQSFAKISVKQTLQKFTLTKNKISLIQLFSDFLSKNVTLTALTKVLRKDSENFTVNHDLFAKIRSNYCTKELYFKIDLTEKNLLSRNIFQVTVR